MKPVRLLLTLSILGIGLQMMASDPPPRERMWEYLINERVMDYPLKTENLFRLAVYAELKGNYMATEDALALDFGSMASIRFFAGHCLLKTQHGQVYSIRMGTGPTVQSESLDASLDELFERLPLMNDAAADPLVVAHVDDHLSRKNLEPFDKLFLRHLLVHYGKYNAELDAVEFHSDWLNTGSAGQMRGPSSPLKIRLDSKILRGYYLNSGGTVYVEDVPRTVAYATGEEYGYNVTAFKVFMEELLVKSVQYVVQEDTKRDPVTSSRKPAGPLPPGYANREKKTIITEGEAVQALYAPEKWMNLMLGILRSRNINIGDADVIRYFVDEDYFEKLYELLLPEEKAKVQAYMDRHSVAAQP